MTDAAIKEMATMLRSTNIMADQFAQRVQERVGEPVSHTQILAVMKKIPAKTLSMNRVVTQMRRQLQNKQN